VRSQTLVKICGVIDADQALACVEAGASAIGVNFVASSPRRISMEQGRAIADAIGKRALVVAVVADMPLSEMLALQERPPSGGPAFCLQLHGEEAADSLRAVLPHAYKAMRIASPDDVDAARAMPGEYLLVDAKVDGAAKGGTGQRFDWSLVVDVAKVRKLVLAGGLRPDNVADAVRRVRPYCVDVASGVEAAGRPGVKDLARVRDFIAAVRAGNESAE
jgi:phosphoribosylanthranilate isomerase